MREQGDIGEMTKQWLLRIVFIMAYLSILLIVPGLIEGSFMIIGLGVLLWIISVGWKRIFNIEAKE